VRKLAFIALLLITSAFTPTKNNTKPISGFETSQTIELKKHHHLYFVEVKINKKKANLLIDTGAAFTIFDINQADSYGFKYYGSDVHLVGLGGTSKRYKLNKTVVEHGENRLKLWPYGADLKQVVQSFSANGIEIVGIIGSDYLTMADAVIDYKKGLLTINK
jgi:predicted aspartyl protease